MKTSTNGKAFLVVGGRSPIAIACSKALVEFGTVLHLTRSISADLLEAFEDFDVQLIEQDLAQPLAGVSAARQAIAIQGQIAGIAFLQRYRSHFGGESFGEHMNVEVWSSIEMLRTVAAERRGAGSVTAVIASSPAAESVVSDQSLDYHLIKASQETSFRYLARELSAQDVECISVRIGSLVIKERAIDFWRQRKAMQNVLGGLGVARGIPDANTIGRQIANILSHGPFGISGQTLILDGGLGLGDGPQAAKNSLEQLENKGPASEI